MDDWKALVNSNKDEISPKSLQNVLHNAQVLLNNDLAPFEVEYILSTLLETPINILNILRDKCTMHACIKPEWDDCVSDILKLLAELISKYDEVDIYYEDIVKLCLLSYPARTRHIALSCLKNITSKSVLPARHLRRYLNSLEENSTCVAPYVLLIGAICEHQPAAVADDFNRIWRTYLNMLDDNKKSLSIKKAVLQGVLGLFKHYGMELTTLELHHFYEKLVLYTKTPKFEDVCLSILENYSSLFREKLSNDITFRGYLWRLERSRSAILSVYKAVTDTVREDQIVEIIDELEQYVNSNKYYQKFTALYAVLYVHTKRVVNSNLNDYIDVQKVNFEIHNGNINYEICDTIFWCVKAKVLYSDKLLQTSLLFYENFSVTKRRELVNCFLEADVFIRQPTAIFLTSYPDSLVWKDLLKLTDENEDSVACVIKDIQNYIISVLEREEESLIEREVLPNNIKSFATILAFLPIQSSFRVLPRYGKVFSEFVPSALLHGNEVEGQETISILDCLNDEDRIRCSLCYVQREEYIVSEMIIALEIILSRKDVSAINIKKAVNKLDKLMQKKELNEKEIAKMLYKVQIVSKRVDGTKRDDKILEREIILFLAKYCRFEHEIPKYNALIKQLEDVLLWKVDVLKLKLGSLIISALEYEDIEALNILFNLICSNLATKRDMTLRKAFLVVSTKLSRYDVKRETGDVTPALWRDVDGVLELLQFILEETSTKSRRSIYNILEEVLKSEETELLEKFLENLLITEQNSKNQAVLELLEICIKMLEDNNLLSKKYLPNILFKVLNIKKYNITIFNMAANLFTDKIELFDGNTVNDTIDNIFKVINNFGSNYRVNIKMALGLIKKIFNLNKNNKSIIDYYFNGNESINLLVLIEIKIIFQLDNLKCKEMLEKNDFLDNFFSEYLNNDKFENDEIIEFVKSFAEFMLKDYELKTVKVIAKSLRNPRQMSSDNVFFIVSLIRSDRHDFEPIISSLEGIINNCPIKEITESVENYSLKKNHEIFLPTLKMASKCFAKPNSMKHSVMIKRWLERIVHLHELGVLERNFENKMEYLTDLVDVSLSFASKEEFMKILLKNEGIKFCRTFIKATFERLVAKPYVFLSPAMKRTSVIIVDILKYAAANNKMDEAFDMAGEVWPVFCEVSTHEERVQALTYLPLLPPSVERWVVDTVNDNDITFDRKIQFVIATSDKISTIHRFLRDHLPSRLSELRCTSATCFKVYLDILSRKNLDLLGPVAQIASNDDKEGWWDEAIQLCMNGLAEAEGESVLSLVHSKCSDSRGYSTKRLLLPLLRCSKVSDCEQLFSAISEDLLSTLKKFPRSADDRFYEERISEYVRALNIAQIMFEKIPKENINKYTKSYNSFVGEVCKLCYTLRDQVEEKFRDYHIANYNCFVAAICLTNPRAEVYRKVFDSNVWRKLIDETQRDLPIRDQWNQRTTRHVVSNIISDVKLRMASVRTRMFTRTLSENPYLYDWTHENVENETVQIQEIIVKDNKINRHPCIATFKSLFDKKTGVKDDVCRKNFEDTIKNNNIHVNPRWLLAQAICNSKEEFKDYASTLQPALLQLIVNSAQNDMLNDLHMDVIDTLIYWNENTDNEYINKTISLLINTAIHYYGSNKNIYYSLIEKLVKLLNIWQNVTISWSIFEEYFEVRNADKIKLSLHILKNILKCNKYIQELVPALLRLFEKKQTYIEICELFGMGLELEKNNRESLNRFRTILDRLHRSDIMEYLKVLYYTQNGCPIVCDYSNFRKITDLLSKITASREKLKCLRILDAYIGNTRNEPVTSLLETVNLTDHLNSVEGLKLAKTSLNILSVPEREKLLSDVLKENYKKELHEHVAEFLIVYLKLKLSPEYEPPAKRPARESNSLLLSDSEIKCDVLKHLSHYGEKNINGLNELLNDDLRIRFYECFYITMILSKSLSDTKLLRMVDLFLNRFKATPKETDLPADLNTHLTKEELGNMLINYSKNNIQLALSFIVQLFQMYPKSPEFDFLDDDIVKLLNSSAPWTIEIIRAADVWQCERLHHVIIELKKQTKGTDLENLTNLLYEEYKLHNNGPEQFSLGLPLCYDEIMNENPTRFSIEDLVSSFGKLSNWSDLTLQQKRSIEAELPSLWTTAEHWKEIIIKEELQDPFWMKAMISTYKNERFLIPYDYYKSPRNYFDLSVIGEISTWNEIRDGQKIKDIKLSDIHPKDCMAQWAARIMLRSAYLDHSTVGAAGRLSRSHEAAWCVRASETHTHHQILACCRRTADLYESEMLQWLYLKLTAVRAIALKKNDQNSLESALDLAEKYVPQFSNMSSDEDLNKMKLITWRLKNDLKNLDFWQVTDWVREIERNPNTEKITENNKKNLESICVLCMEFLDRCNYSASKYDREVMFSNAIYEITAKILSIYVQLNLGNRSSLLADVIINKLSSNGFERVLNTESKLISEAIYLIKNDLSYISLEQLRQNKSAFCDPSHQLWKCLDEDKVETAKCHLALIGDPQHLLFSFCQQLLTANDIEIFEKTFNEMKKAIFENDLAQMAPDYQILNKYKGMLYNVKFEDTQKTKEALHNVMSQLEKGKDYICLSQVCPALAGARGTEDVRKAMCNLFRLKSGVKIVKFEEKIQIMTNTLHHPAILSCRLSNGKVLRCMVKRGERVRIHCAAMAINNTLGLKRGYRITPLSDTCCLIEYLEDHVPLRKLITSKYKIDLSEINYDDKELILDTTKSLQQFQKLCDKIPSYMLRYAIEENATSIQDFIYKKMNFLQSVCDMTIFSYICGMSDRHLENMMYSQQDGGACHVDCDAILQDGGEIPPARLTRNILAVCDAQVLEARVQSKLSELREEYIILPSLSLIFKWIGYVEKFNQVEKIIQGKELCFNTTIESLRLSKLSYKEKYIELLKKVFEDFQHKNEYTVEEQVSSLFRQSTDPRILSVTRYGWEPWV